MASSSSLSTNECSRSGNVLSDSLCGSSVSDRNDDSDLECPSKRLKSEISEKRQKARDFHFALRPLSVFEDFRCTNLCKCFGCDHEHFSTFHLAYFMYFGLQFCFFPLADKGLKITDSVIAQAYFICEERVKRCNRVFSLQDICVFKIVSRYSDCLNQINFPEKLRRHIDRFVGGFDIADSLMSKKVGNTIFRPLAFPRFLFLHRGKYLGGFDKTQFQLSSQYDLDSSEKIVK